MENKNTNLKRYKGAYVQYKCIDCNIYDSLEEDFTTNISRIKSGSCPHNSIKFIYNLEGDSFKYILSFTCGHCGKNQLINVFEKITEDSPNIFYRCVDCHKSSIEVFFLLIIKEDIKFYKTPENIIKVYRTPDKNENDFNLNQINNEFEKNMVLGGEGGREGRINIKEYKTPNDDKNNKIPFNTNNHINSMYSNNIEQKNEMNITNRDVNLKYNDINTIRGDNDFNNNINNNDQINITFIDNRKNKFKIKTSLHNIFHDTMMKVINENNKYIDVENIKEFQFKGKVLDKNKSLKDNGLKEGDEIAIIFEN